AHDQSAAMHRRAESAPGAGYPVDSAPYPRHSAANLPARPTANVRTPPVWHRWLLIGGSAVLAIALAFVIARLARGSGSSAGVPPSARPPAQSAAPAPPQPAAPPPAPPPARDGAAPAQSAAQPAPSRGDAVALAAQSAAATPPARGAAVDPPPSPGPAADPGADSGEVAPDEDGEAVAGGTPVVGSGPCRFTVATTPAGSVVRFDDQAMGPSPITIEGSCDKHRVDVSHVRYQSVTRWVTLTAEQPQSLDLNLPRPIHAVTVTSFPPGAELSIDGHRAGTTPTVVQMTGFASVNLTFSKPGFQSVTRRVYSKLAQDRVFVKLLK
ncbi:MAG TPA: PEGA domain-containing protein, partial [Kofleriaceae bacterium]|nr:PEGA domain-containing protein [Kofleriaceae bacterium]